jgi:hypothetical protein
MYVIMPSPPRPNNLQNFDATSEPDSDVGRHTRCAQSIKLQRSIASCNRRLGLHLLICPTWNPSIVKPRYPVTPKRNNRYKLHQHSMQLRHDNNTNERDKTVGYFPDSAIIITNTIIWCALLESIHLKLLLDHISATVQNLNSCW